MRDLILFLTDFADLAIVLPLSLLVAIWLLIFADIRIATIWLAVVLGTLSVMLLLKLATFSYAGPLAWVGLKSPSGHTAAGTVTYAGLLLLCGGARLQTLRASFLVSLAFATAFGSSRLLLGFHSLADVLVGAAIGIAGTVMMVSRLQPFGFNPSVERLPALMVVASTLVLILHGCRLPAELMLRTHHEIFSW